MQAVNLIHRTAFTYSNGVLFGRVLGMPVVKLTTTGRKSGRPRTTMLTSPATDGDNLVLVASNGGSPRHPDWFLNLRDHPEVEVTTRGFSGRRRARVATPEEKARIWPDLTRRHKNYAGYQKKTSRDIPLVILEPTG